MSELHRANIQLQEGLMQSMKSGNLPRVHHYLQQGANPSITLDDTSTAIEFLSQMNCESQYGRHVLYNICNLFVKFGWGDDLVKTIPAGDVIGMHLLREHGLIVGEGNIGDVPQENEFLTKAAMCKPGARVCEIGFNAGHSAYTCLQGSSATVLSFDIGHHIYTGVAKRFIDNTFPGRHTLIIGDSRITVPAYIDLLQKVDRFDVIFIDGGHTYECASSDIRNCRSLAGPRTILIIDDVERRPGMVKGWNTGVNDAWDDAVKTGICREQRYVTGDKPGRGFVVGTYVF